MFHDAAENPVAFVPSVKQALDELLAEPGVARKVEAQGSMLLVEKLADLDQADWYAKDDPAFSSRAGVEFTHTGSVGPSISLGGRPAPIGSGPNLLGPAGETSDAWDRTGLAEPNGIHETTDHAADLLVETTVTGQHGLSAHVTLDTTRFVARFFVRPTAGVSVTARLSTASGEGVSATFDFEAGNVTADDGNGVVIAVCETAFMNSYFHCTLEYIADSPPGESLFSILLTDPEGNTVYNGNPARGVVFNLASIRSAR